VAGVFEGLGAALMMLPVVPEPNSQIDAQMVMSIEARVSEMIRAIDDFDELLKWRDSAAALEAYLRSRGLQRPMLGAQRRVESRIGQLLGDSEGGYRPDLTPLHIEGVDHNQRADFRVLAKALDGGVLTDEEQWRKSRRALVMLIRQLTGDLPKTPPLPEGQFSCIVADPPWQLDTGPKLFGGTIERGHDDLEYTQLDLEAISELGVESIAAPNAHLYLWTTNRYLRDSYEVAESWGFRPSVVLTWCKAPRGVGLGDTFRLTTEYILFARRGKLAHQRIVPTTWFTWPRGRHSKKPAEFYELVESVTPGPYVDLYARRPRTGWAVWGEEVS